MSLIELLKSFPIFSCFFAQPEEDEFQSRIDKIYNAIKTGQPNESAEHLRNRVISIIYEMEDAWFLNFRINFWMSRDTVYNRNQEIATKLKELLRDSDYAN